MIVCLCHRISDRDIRREAAEGCTSFGELQDNLRVATACGACLDCARETFAAAAGACGSCPGAYRAAERHAALA
jgi:bacterioferritin-associated ferredoxin